MNQTHDSKTQQLGTAPHQSRRRSRAPSPRDDKSYLPSHDQHAVVDYTRRGSFQSCKWLMPHGIRVCCVWSGALAWVPAAPPTCWWCDSKTRLNPSLSGQPCQGRHSLGKRRRASWQICCDRNQVRNKSPVEKRNHTCCLPSDPRAHWQPLLS